MTRRTPLIHWFLAGLVGIATIAGGAAAVMTLQVRADSTEEQQVSPAITVSVERLVMQQSYEVSESYVGQVEPARLTTPSFERSGKVMALLFDEGDTIAEGQVIAVMDTRSLLIEKQRLEADRASIVADMELAQRTVDRREQLVDDGWASRQAYDEAQFALTALSARRDAVSAAMAAIDLDLEKSELTAPFSGTVSARMIDEGTVVASGTPVLSLQETTRPQARIGVPADRAGVLRAGQSLEMLYQGRELTGEIVAVTRDLQEGTRSIPLLIDIQSAEPLTMGEVIRLNLTREIASQGAWVPLSALREAERGLWSINTAVQEEGGWVTRREAVEVLHVSSERAFVRGTFRDGAMLVAKGGHRLSAGQRVEPAGEI
ncbi:MAG: efflux RND transporter periplasmic adaptor subunit [Pseudomonadota bacterium]